MLCEKLRFFHWPRKQFSLMEINRMWGKNTNLLISASFQVKISEKIIGLGTYAHSYCVECGCYW